MCYHPDTVLSLNEARTFKQKIKKDIADKEKELGSILTPEQRKTFTRNAWKKHSELQEWQIENHTSRIFKLEKHSELQEWQIENHTSRIFKLEGDSYRTRGSVTMVEGKIELIYTLLCILAAFTTVNFLLGISLIILTKGK